MAISELELHGVFFVWCGLLFSFLLFGVFLFEDEVKAHISLTCTVSQKVYFSVLKSLRDSIAYKEKIISEAFSQKSKPIFQQS